MNMVHKSKRLVWGHRSQMIASRTGWGPIRLWAALADIGGEVESNYYLGVIP